ncbi:hypothetical protein EIZ48_28610 [Photobacterium alginatilyticum]|uniref:Uncharacterized protein n=1 Tax=Photobacterium alginatilyticum TaxID=1775171 RepID=A0ABW9YRP6_9GAMM|nr:hypothetical protein [Photobacterium alginatilyticum]
MKFRALLIAINPAKSSVRRTKPIILTVRYTGKRSDISLTKNDLLAAKLDPTNEKQPPRCLCKPVP